MIKKDAVRGSNGPRMDEDGTIFVGYCYDPERGELEFLFGKNPFFLKEGFIGQSSVCRPKEKIPRAIKDQFRGMVLSITSIPIINCAKIENNLIMIDGIVNEKIVPLMVEFMETIFTKAFGKKVKSVPLFKSKRGHITACGILQAWMVAQHGDQFIAICAGCPCVSMARMGLNLEQIEAEMLIAQVLEAFNGAIDEKTASIVLLPAGKLEIVFGVSSFEPNAFYAWMSKQLSKRGVCLPTHMLYRNGVVGLVFSIKDNPKKCIYS